MEILRVEFLLDGFAKNPKEWLSIDKPKRINIIAKFKKRDFANIESREYVNVIERNVDISHTNLFQKYLLNELSLEPKIIDEIKMYILNTSQKELKWD